MPENKKHSPFITDNTSPDDYGKIKNHQTGLLVASRLQKAKEKEHLSNNDWMQGLRSLDNNPFIHDALIESIYNAGIDRLTGLYTDNIFFEDGIEVISKAIEIQNDNVEVDREKLHELAIVRADIGFLGYANDLAGGHDKSGNTYKINMASLISGEDEQIKKYLETAKIHISGYIMTKGDELAMIIEGTPEQTEQFIEAIRKRVREMRIGVDGDNPELPASLSIDYVSADEFIDEFVEFEKENNLIDEGFYERYVDFLSHMADFRAIYQKIVERLILLRDLAIKSVGLDENKFHYLYLRQFILKSAAKISSEDLSKLMLNDSDREEEYVTKEEYIIRSKRWVKNVLTQRLYRAISDAKNGELSKETLFEIGIKKKVLDSL